MAEDVAIPGATFKPPHLALALRRTFAGIIRSLGATALTRGRTDSLDWMNMLKILLIIVGIIFLIGILVVTGLLSLIF